MPIYSPLVLKFRMPSAATFDAMEWVPIRRGFRSKVVIEQDGAHIPMFTIRQPKNPHPYTEIVFNDTGETLRMVNPVMAKSYAASIYSGVAKRRSQCKRLLTKEEQKRREELRGILY